MACCVLKSFCGCGRLRTGSLIIGLFLLVLNALWLYFVSIQFYNFFKYFRRIDFNFDPRLRTAVIMSVVNEVRLVLEVIFTIILIFGLYKNKQGILRAFYPPSAICFVVDIILYIFALVFFGIHIDFVSEGVLIAAEIITKFITCYFLLLVRSNYHQSGVTGNTGAVYSSTPKQSKLGIYYV